LAQAINNTDPTAHGDQSHAALGGVLDWELLAQTASNRGQFAGSLGRRHVFAKPANAVDEVKGTVNATPGILIRRKWDDELDVADRQSKTRPQYADNRIGLAVEAD
jgi:hypothetical protein